MITQFVVGSGNSRKVIPLVRDKSQRRAAADALKGHLFPNRRAFNQAMASGRKRAKAYRAERKGD